MLGETQENLHQKITLAQPSKILLKDYSQMLYRFSFCFALLILTPFSPIFRAFLSLSIHSFPRFPLAPIFDFDVTQILNFTCRNIPHTIESHQPKTKNLCKNPPKRARELENQRKKNGIRCALKFCRFLVLFSTSICYKSQSQN